MARRCVFEGEDDEEDLFFDSREDISSSADSCPGSPQKQFPSSSEENFVGCRVWVSNLDSVRERRDKFARLMGMDLNYASGKSASDFDGELLRDDEIAPDIERIMSDDGAVLRSSSSDNGSSSISSWSAETPSTSGDGVSEENFECRIKNLNDGTVFLVDELGKDGSVRSLREVGSNRTVTVAEFGKKFGSSSFIQQHMRRDDSSSTSSDSEKTVSRRRRGWLRRLGIGAFVVDREKIETKSRFSEFDQSGGAKVERVKVRTYKKKSKEFSAVYKRQDIKAHDGAILTMKFSPDGELLATGGEDGVVRVWRVMECEPSDDCCIPEDDPACMYFTVNENSELAPLHANSEKKGKAKNMKRSTDSACVVIPSNVFRISHEPLHEFRGHVGDVLDLSWSKDKHLLSSSIDKTVRLWQIGCTSCLNVFSHRNYVTSVQFDPNNENYFVSGSIDGKVRIWEISRCHVVDWTDVKDIVTAVCYRQEGKGVVVGTITGNCRFYDASDNHLQLEAQLSLQGRKKSPHKRITGFQFCPTDPKKLLVTSADSKIRILDGVDIVCKYKGIKSASSQISASFTPGGHHIISASEDSNIYIWNHENQDGPTVTHAKSTWSCERFFSSNASVAIPWNGSSQKDIFRDLSMISEDSLVGSGNFTLSHEYFAGFLPRGSATWPEEKLPCDSISASTLDRSQYKFLQASCQSASRAWGRVIVTAGWDGWIRSFQNCGLPLHL